MLPKVDAPKAPEKLKPIKAPVIEPIAKVAQVTTPQPTVAQTAPKQATGSKTQQMAAAGIPQSDWQYVDSIISRESGWRHTVWNTTGSGAYGLCQSLPATKMASAGSDYMTNPITQLKWCHSYAQERYGSWAAAHSFWNNNHWW